MNWGQELKEIEGADYAKRFLRKLSGCNASVIFSTQITKVGEFAQDELGAKCFAFDLEHRIRPGIGTGGANKLMSRIGIDRLLS